MTGPEHYREAENLLAMASEQIIGIAAGDPTAGDPDSPALLVAEAQVHATLALAAAAGVNDAEVGMMGNDRSEWLETAGERAS